MGSVRHHPFPPLPVSSIAIIMPADCASPAASLFGAILFSCDPVIILGICPQLESAVYRADFLPVSLSDLF